VPGTGSLHVQSTYNPDALTRGTQLLAAGLAPEDIIADLTRPEFDADAESRQYGIADVLGRTATFTGRDTQSYAADRRGKVGTLVYAAQGNILTSGAVLEQASAAFESSGCDLPERLMRALEAGAAAGEGDRRCTETRGIPSDSAFLRVDGPNFLSVQGSSGRSFTPIIDLRVPTSGDENPLFELRAAFDAWRSDHPCARAGDESEPPGVPPGCGCDLPRGRTRTQMAFFPLGVALWLARRRRARERFSGNPSAVSRE
jgi:uncharacterized Ntn-hydrolase superfamily protein